MESLKSSEEINNFLSINPASLIYFSTPNCTVCKVLRPKLIEFINSDFPRISMAYVNIEKLPDFAAQASIFSVPTILIYFEGKEFLRKSRNINFLDLFNELERPYSLYF
jgi:thiol-disulfide isomerase/thioredoxin